MPNTDRELREIGKYRITGVLYKDSTGSVCKARDPELGRTVAIKILDRFFSDTKHLCADSFERFKVESRILSTLRHPNIPAVFEVGFEGEFPYIVMDFIDGESLDSLLLREGKIPAFTAVKWIAHVASSIDYAHRKGVLHSDINPGKFITDKFGSIFLLDFGICPILNSLLTIKLADSGIQIGISSYMSPEQFSEGKVDRRSDLFSFAVVAFEMLTGKKPFSGDTDAIATSNILGAEPLLFSEASATLPVELDPIFKRALSKAPAERMESAEAFAKAIEFAIVHGRPRVEKASDASLEDTDSGRTSAIIRVSKREQDSVRRESGGERAQSRWVFRNVQRAGELFGPDAAPLYDSERESRNRFAVKVLLVSTMMFTFTIGALLVFSSATSLKDGKAATVIKQVREFTAGHPARGLSQSQIRGLSDEDLLAGVTDLTLPETHSLAILREGRKRGVPGFAGKALVLLAHKSYVVRLEVLKIIAESGEVRFAALVERELGDVDPLVRAQAARTLGGFRERAAQAALEERLTQEQVPEVRAAINDALVKIASQAGHK